MPEAEANKVLGEGEPTGGWASLAGWTVGAAATRPRGGSPAAETLPREVRLIEQTADLTLEPPTAPFGAPTAPAAAQAAQGLSSGAPAFALAGLAPAHRRPRRHRC